MLFLWLFRLNLALLLDAREDNHGHNKDQLARSINKATLSFGNPAADSDFDSEDKKRVILGGDMIESFAHAFSTETSAGRGWWPCPPCPPCFHCTKPQFKCSNWSKCNTISGLCEECPTGLGGDGCSEPLLGSPLLDNKARQLRNKEEHENKADGSNTTLPIWSGCDSGWKGIMCNLCDDKSAKACGLEQACYDTLSVIGQTMFMPSRSVFMQCDAQLPQFIKSFLRDKPTSITGECYGSQVDEKRICDLQFWLETQQQFYCRLEDCQKETKEENTHDQSEDKKELIKTISTLTTCKKAKCDCVQGSELCTPSKMPFMFDLQKVLVKVKGPAQLNCNSIVKKDKNSSKNSNCSFHAPTLDDYFKDGIGLFCNHGQCLYRWEVPKDGILADQSLFKRIILLTINLLLLLIGALIVYFVIIRTGMLMWKLHREINKHSDYAKEDNGKEPLLWTLKNHPIINEGGNSFDQAGCSLAFTRLTYQANEKPIIKDISGVIRSGQLVAIIGPSGAGKSTLLDMLALRKSSRNTESVANGALLINGSIVSDKHAVSSLIGYVDQQQDSLLLGTLTVQETLMYSALLRLPQEMSIEEKRSRVGKVMQTLGIAHLAHHRIQSKKLGRSTRQSSTSTTISGLSTTINDENNKGGCLSGGERRRVSIAQELVTDPQILLLDEPTSGLDSHSALIVMRALYDLAHVQGRTVICTIHQPRTNIFGLFDKIIVMTKGRMIYSGTRNGLQEYFETIMHQSADGYNNVADWVMDMLGQEEADEPSPATLAEAFINSEAGGRLNRELADQLTGTISQGSASVLNPHTALVNAKSWSMVHHQLIILSTRTLINLIRDPMLILAHYLMSFILALFLGVLFWQVTNDMAGVQNRLGSLFFTLAFFAFSTLTTLDCFCAKERGLFLRERAAGCYDPGLYFVSRSMLDVVVLRIGPVLLFSCIAYPMIGFVREAVVFGKFLLTLVMFIYTSTGVSMLIATLFNSNQAVASLISSIDTLLAMLFGGFLLNKTHITSALRFLLYSSWFNYAYEALLVNELGRVVIVPTDLNSDFGNPGEQLPNISIPGSIILKQFGFDQHAFWWDLSILSWVLGGIAWIGAWAGMLIFVKERR